MFRKTTNIEQRLTNNGWVIYGKTYTKNGRFIKEYIYQKNIGGYIVYLKLNNHRTKINSYEIMNNFALLFGEQEIDALNKLQEEIIYEIENCTKEREISDNEIVESVEAIENE